MMATINLGTEIQDRTKAKLQFAIFPGMQKYLFQSLLHRIKYIQNLPTTLKNFSSSPSLITVWNERKIRYTA